MSEYAVCRQRRSPWQKSENCSAGSGLSIGGTGSHEYRTDAAIIIAAKIHKTFL